MKKCPECDSEKIISRAKLLDRGDRTELIIAVDENPLAMVFKKRTTSDISAKVCGDCGFIRFYAKSAGNLWMAYQNLEK